MKTYLTWISRKKYLLAPVFLLALVLTIAACGSNPTAAPAGGQSASNVIPATSPTEDLAAMEAKKMEEEAMAMEAEKMEEEAMAVEAEKMEAEKMEKEAMAMEAEKMEKEALAIEAEKMEAEKMEADAMMESGPSLKLDLSGVQPLANGYHYEGWAIIDGNPVSTGKFNIGPDGNLIKLDGTVKDGGVFHSVKGLETASDLIITIEPAGDTDDIPAATHYLAGSLSDGTATLSVGHAAALGNDFSSAAGVYILATPTNGDDTDENSGIWFLDLSSGSPEVGLDLPVLPGGWVFEGWVVIDGMPVSSGRFTDVNARDLDDPYSGTEGGPPFPGEDYLNNAPAGLSFPIDLSGGTAVISVEPSPDDSSAPFTLKPLVGAIDADAADHQTYQLANGANENPSGTAVVGEF